MASGNKSLGRFELTGIAPAPRGMPQIDVTFDIDANGIVNVSAKDQATGKEQSIRITSSSGLSKEEIDQLIKDAELHAEDDKRKKELVDARNAADAMVYSVEKAVAEAGDKVDAATRHRVEESVAALKQAMEKDDTSEIKRLTEELTHASHALSQTMYQGAQGCAAGDGGCGQHQDTSDAPKPDDDVVDAEFKEVA